MARAKTKKSAGPGPGWQPRLWTGEPNRLLQLAGSTEPTEQEIDEVADVLSRVLVSFCKRLFMDGSVIQMVKLFRSLETLD